MSWDKGSRNTTYKLWNVAKSVLRGKFIAMNDCVCKEIFQSDCINLHFHQQCRTFLFSTPSPAFIVCKLFDDPMDVGNLTSGSFHFSKTSLNIWKFMVHVLLKSGLENFQHYFASMWNECNYSAVRAFFGTAFLWDWNENWSFPVLWPLLSFPNLLAYWVQHFNKIIWTFLWGSHLLEALKWGIHTLLSMRQVWAPFI